MKIMKNVKLCKPGGDAPVDILVSGREIVAIEDRLNFNIKNVEIIDCCGRIAIPGYIDQHVHITGGGGEGGFQNRVPELKLSECIRGGVTTLVGLLGTDATTRSVENLVSKTKELKIGGLTAFCLTGAYEYPCPTITGSVKKDIVFIEECIGVKIAISDHRCSNISREDMIRLASEARLGGVVSGKPGLVHIHVGSGKRGLDMLIDIVEKEDIPVKVFRPTHMGTKFDEALHFAELGGYIDISTGIDCMKTAGIVAKAIDKVKDKSLVTLSTDANGSIPKWNEKKEIIGITYASITTMHETVLHMVCRCGLPLHEAIRPVTENVAKALNIFPRKGTLAIGSDADIILLDDALKIDTVLAQGQIMMRNKEVLKKGTFED